MQVQWDGCFQKRLLVAPVGDEIVVLGLANQNEMHEVEEPGKPCEPVVWAGYRADEYHTRAT